MRTPTLRDGFAQTTEPWFRQRPLATIGVSAVLFAAMFVIRLFVGDASDALLVLFVFPISLLAITFGARVGLLAGFLSVALIVVWALVDGVDLSFVGWLSRIGPLVFLGVLVGDAADRLGRADEERQAFELAEQRHRQAVEVNDSLLQGMAAAKWSIESGRLEAASATLEATIVEGQRLVSDALRSAELRANGHSDQSGHNGQPPGPVEGPTALSALTAASHDGQASTTSQKES